jgi:hypothetical protein
MAKPTKLQDQKDTHQQKVFVFGSQVLSPNKQCLEKLLRPLSNGAAPDWILDTVAGLPEYWDALTKKIPGVAGSIPGSVLLADLDTWLRRGLDDGEHATKLPNILLTPLVIISQLTQYWHYLKLQHTHGVTAATDFQAALVARQTDERDKETVGSLGFCIGLLSSFAVASSSNQQEFEKHGAVAIRLAMLTGALADAQEGRSRGIGQGRSVVYATAWRNTKQREAMINAVESLSPEAYVSVLWDEDRATITVSKRKALALAAQLRTIGVTAVEVGLKARVHNPHPNISRHTDALLQLCREKPGLCFPDAADLVLPTFANAGDGNPVSPGSGSMHEMALRAVLVQQCNWYGTVSSVLGVGKEENSSDGIIVSFGPEHCMPPSLTRLLGSRLVNFSALDEDNGLPEINPHSSQPVSLPELASAPELEAGTQSHQQQYLAADPCLVDSDAIAVIGMSIKVAGADDVNEFSQMLQTGDSQHEIIDSDRIKPDTLFRNTDQPQPVLYGNFIRDADAFDHKFFKRSPRESATMDPQQRLFLQGAYHAVEQSGYFTETTSRSNMATRDKAHVGVYVGSCAGDYGNHIACHPANAFSATGAMRSFVPGKVSHHFGVSRFHNKTAVMQRK